MAKNIGATLSLKNGNFFANMKSAVSASEKLNSSLNKTTKTASSFGSKMKSVGSGIVAVGKGLAVAGTAAATAVAALVSKSVNSFSDYEQLTGGIDTLFKESSAALQKYANEAYKTAGLSANDYMETVTSFSASLISSLGGDTRKAAIYANSALVDMSDNANKMGTNMSDVQNAYKGFAKQNYTMLDNLKLGYGGTKEEMQRLLNDAQKLTGQKYDISSFADITQAIHAVQTQMDITGTTAKEASTTISGSWNSMKSAFQNVLVGLTTGGAMFEDSLDALVDTSITFGKNIIPAIKGALDGVGHLIEGLAPVIGKTIPPLINDLIPTLANSAVSLVQALVDGLTQNAPQFADCLNNLVVTTVNGLSTIVPELLNAASQIVGNLLHGLTAAAPQIVDGAVSILNGLADGLINNAPIIIMGAAQLITALAGGLISNLPKIIDAAINLILGIINVSFSMMPQIIQMGIQLVVQLTVGLIQAIPQLVAALPQIIGAIWNGITSINWLDLGVQVVKGILEGIISLGAAIFDSIKFLFQPISNVFIAVKDTAMNIFETIKQGIVNKIQQAKDSIVNIFDTIKSSIGKVWDGIKNLIKAPHIEVVGNLSIAGLSTPIPKLGLKWYAQGGIMTRPTMFGMSGSTAHVGGEAGAEAILPLKPFWDKLDKALKQKTESGRNSINIDLDVNINADNRNPEDLADQVINAFVPKLKMAMANL